MRSVKKTKTRSATGALKKLLESRMTAYSAAAGAVLAGGAAARAAIVYTPVDITLSGSTYQIDFLNDGSDDVLLSHGGRYWTGFISHYGVVMHTVSNTNYVNGSGRFMVDTHTMPLAMPLALTAGAPISDGSAVSGPIVKWARSVRTYSTAYGPTNILTNTLAYGNFLVSTSTYGNIFGTTGKYLGVTILDGPNKYYGWIQLDVADDILDAHISGYAYNDTPDGPIDAGEIPEPGSLALLALGAAGVAARRRKRLQ